MDAFYKKRLASHRKNMLKYMRYILNDHFLLVMLISVGGFGLYYSEFVKSIDSSFLIGKFAAILFCLLTLFVGKLATLMKDADSIFLLPKEREMKSYFIQSLKHSIPIPFIVIGLVTAIMMPLFVATGGLIFSDFFFLVLNLWLLKFAHLLIQLEMLYLNTDKETMIQQGVFWLMSILTMCLNVLVFPWLGIPISLLFLAGIYLATQKALANNPLDWDKSISLERKRLKKIYSFINLFTDVPGLNSEVKRRAYLDVFLNRIKKEQGQTYKYLYSRVFLRGSEYSGLVFRLSLIGSLILIFSDQFILNGIISVLFIYLIGFQLLPMYSEFDYMLMTQLYPVKKEQKIQAVQQIISLILLSVSVLFSLILLINLDNKLNALAISAILIVESLLFTYLYATKRLKKMEKSLI